MYEIIKAKLVGVYPVLMHNGQLADPLNKYAKELKEVSSKRTKTDADHEEMARIEWMGGLYTNEKGAPCFPGDVIEAWVKEGGKKNKLGKLISAAVFCDKDSFPIEYSGPKDPAKMWKLERFRDRRSVKVGQARVMRTRPIFRNWSAQIELMYNPELITRRQLEKALADAGAWGICDYRPRFGRCRVEVTN